MAIIYVKELPKFILLITLFIFIISCTQQFSRVNHSYEPLSIADRYSDDYQIHNLECAESNVKTWAKVFGGHGVDKAESIQQTPDGGYVLAGYSNSGPTDSAGEKQYDVLLFKVDDEGNTLWEKIYGGSRLDYPRSMEKTDDGGFILGGETNSLPGGTAYLIKTDADGNLQWEKNFDICGDALQGRDTIMSVRQTMDGGYIASGWATSCESSTEYNFLLKTDAKGNKVWETDYVFWRETFIDTTGRNSVIQTADGGYAVLGYVNHYIPGKVSGKNIYLMKADSEGKILWNNTLERTDRINQTALTGHGPEEYGWSEWTEANSFQETADGSYILGGGTGGLDAVGGIFLVKVDASGNKVWDKVISEDSFQGGVFSIKQTSDGGYFLIGYGSVGGGYENRVVIIGDKVVLDNGLTLYLLKTDADGNIESETFGRQLYGGNMPIQQTSDGGYISAEIVVTRLGATQEANTTDILVMKMNEDGIVCNLAYGQPCTLVPEPRWVSDPACRDVVYDEEYINNPYVPK